VTFTAGTTDLGVKFALAERLSMTVGQLETNMTELEWRFWKVKINREVEEAKNR
jgi:hypothetical protein